MNNIFLDKVKQILVDEKNKLLSKPNIMEIDIDGDETDEIQGNILAYITSQLESRDLIRLKKIEMTLKAINTDSYGSCEECGELIAEKRLEVNPCFTTCISCAEQLEIEALQRKR